MEWKNMPKDHYVIELSGLDKEIIDGQDSLSNKLDQLSDKLNLTVVNRFFHRFNPIGITAIYVLAESHLAVHSWPEMGYLHIDLFTCSSKVDFSNLEDYIKQIFSPSDCNIREVKYDSVDENGIRRVCSMRPSANRDIDQVHMRPESVVKQLEHLREQVHGKDVMLLGDDDFLSVLIVTYLNPKSVTVFDVDKRVLKSLKNLGVDTKFYNALHDVPVEFRAKYDFFITNPPYGSRNNGESGCFFINKCLEFCKDDAGGCFILPYDKKLPMSLEAMYNVQQFLNRKGCVIKDVKHSIHTYHHEDVNLTSSSYIIDRIKKTDYNPNFGNIELY